MSKNKKTTKKPTYQTIAAAIAAAFALANKPITFREVYEIITGNGFYRFGAKNPTSVIGTEIRRRCENITISKPHSDRPFKAFEGNKYGLIAAEMVKTAEVKTDPLVNLNPKTGVKFSNSDLEDLRLIEAIQKGDKSAQSRLYKKHEAFVFRRASRSVGFDADKAKDITQDIMLKMFENLDRYKVDYSFSTWLSRIASNCIIDASRSRKKKEDITLSITGYGFESEESEHGIQIPCANNNPEEIMIENQHKAKLETAMENLKPREKEALAMFYYENMSYQEISEKLSIEIGKLRVMIHRAKKNLKERLIGSTAVA
jgi:RNA polymerase sigma-70 factor (ECF subfamily)